MCDFKPNLPKPKVLPEKTELPAEPPKPLKIGTADDKRKPGSNPFRIDLAASSSTRGTSGAQV